ILVAEISRCEESLVDPIGIEVNAVMSVLLRRREVNAARFEYNVSLCCQVSTVKD
ncbi:hypothetical protein Tco_0021114, partial [Tanacetum coccineum]